MTEHDRPAARPSTPNADADRGPAEQAAADVTRLLAHTHGLRRAVQLASELTSEPTNQPDPPPATNENTTPHTAT